LPLVVYLAGLGTNGGVDDLQPSQVERLSPAPFMLAAPLKSKEQWWTLSKTSSTQYGWIEGELLEQRIEAFVNWVEFLAQDRRIDSDLVSLMGFSAGAYAVTEIYAQSRMRFHCLVLGGVHGHGQPDNFNEIPGKLLRRVDVWDKWKKYLARLSQGLGARSIYSYHHRHDKMCKWSHAELILDKLDERQLAAGESRAQRFEVPDWAGSSAHNYHNYKTQAFHRKELIQHLVTRGDVWHRQH